jgi:ribosome-binding protein aMBF1 (putative translation factor)
VIVFAIDHLNFTECTKAVCLNGFIKKSNKDYLKAIKEAERIFRRVFKKHEVMKTYKAIDLLNERYGQKGSESGEKFRENAYSYYFGEIIRNRRKELNMSQEKLAEVVGKKRPYISRIENGEDVRISNLMLVANALDLTIELTIR